MVISTCANHLISAAAFLWCIGGGGAFILWAADLPALPLDDAHHVRQWEAANDVSAIRHTPDGMIIEISGDDPYVFSPAVDLPVGEHLWLRVRVRSEQGGEFKLYPFDDAAGPAENRTIAAHVAPGAWSNLRLPMPPLGNGGRLRIDPPGTGGSVTIASLAFERRLDWRTPQWPQPIATRRKLIAIARSGETRIAHDGRQFGSFDVHVNGRRMAVGWTPGLVGYAKNDTLHWLKLDGRPEIASTAPGEAFVEMLAAKDEDGVSWTLRRSFAASKTPGAIDVRVDIKVDRERSAVFLPALVLLAGAGEGSFGATKSQALLAGLEYLEDEPSSSEADVVGAASKRQVPDSLKLTFPLSAISAGGHFLALAWERHPDVAALFDTPDRLFGSGGHVMGLLAPGSDGDNRVEGNLLPHTAKTIHPNRPLSVRATIFGGAGETVAPAVQGYVQMHGLPPVPETGLSLQQYIEQTAAGWIDSKLREGPLVRHAVWPGFGAKPAADAAVWMRWLARRSEDAALAGRLDASAAEALSAVDPSAYDAAAVSHVRYPVASLLFGHVEENAATAEANAHRLLERFEQDGTFLYRPEQGKPDFARTHFARHANGLTASRVSQVLQCAAISGKAGLIDKGVALLRALDRYDNTVPRGAQTWEIPLHTPDILAAAHLVRAYTLGYELTGDAQLLRRAIAWAWTGVPFVYLDNPTDGKIGPYATIAVYGATGWQAPVWFGQPVQWCGLVYADALYRLACYDAQGLWKQLADGITASGIQQSWRTDDPDRKGLLPDFFHLRAQVRDGPAINPGTVQANAIRLLGGPQIFDYAVLREAGVIVHAPGRIASAVDENGVIRFKCKPWDDRACFILISGLAKRPGVRVNQADPDAAAFDAENGRLVLKVQGAVNVELRGG